MEKETGFLLSYRKYGDYDAVLHCFTKEKGFGSYFVKGIYSSKKNKKAYLTPLQEFQFYLIPQNVSGKLIAVKNLDAVSQNYFHEDVKISSIIFFVADFLNQVLRNEGENLEIYRAISLFLEELKINNNQAHFQFIFNILKCMGVAPLYGSATFLNPETGNFTDKLVHPKFDDVISGIWKEYIINEERYKIKISKSLRKAFLDSLLLYYALHFSDFRTPVSYEVVQSIFE